MNKNLGKQYSKNLRIITKKTAFFELNKKTKSDIKMITCLFIMTRALFFLFLLYCRHIANIEYDSGSVYLLYDGIHFFNIAMQGYTEAYQYAFFPLFPLIIRFFALFNIPIVGTLVLNHLMTLVISYLLYFTGLNILNKSHDVSLTMAKFWIFSPIAISTLFCTLSHYLFCLL